MRVNWVTKLFIYFLIISLAGPFFDNWTSAEKILFMNDAYSGLCPQSVMAGPATGSWRCEAQQLAVSGLLSYARMIEFLSSVVTGIFVDIFGPKIVAVVGVVLAITSWLFMTLFPKSGIMLKLSMILIGISTNATLFPALTIERYTKKYKGQSMILICSTSSITCLLIKFVEIISRTTHFSARTINLYYCLLCLVPCLIASAIFFPNDLKADVKMIGEGYDEREFVKEHVHYNELVKQVSIIGRQMSLEPKGMKEFKVEKIRKTLSCMDMSPFAKRFIDNGKDIGGKKKWSNREVVAGDTPRDIENGTGKPKWTWRGFFDALKSYEMALCTLYYCLNVISITFSQQSFTIVYSDQNSLLEFAEYTLPFSFLPCIFFMLITSFSSQYFLILTIGILWVAMNISSLHNGFASGVLTAILFPICYSIYNTQVYIYIEEFVDKDYYSSTLGFLNTIGGLSMFLNILAIAPIKDFRVITTIQLTLMVIRIVFLVIFTTLFVKKLIRKRKDEVPRTPSAERIAN